MVSLVEKRTSIALPDGRVLHPGRKRSLGPLDRLEVEFCRAKEIPLAYDPVQLGWVPLDVEDDIDPYEEIAIARPDLNRPDGFAAPHRTTPHRSMRFRRWQEADLPDYLRMLGNPRVWDLLPDAIPDPFTEDTARSLIAISNAGTHHDVYAVEIEGQPVGQVRLLFDMASPERRKAEISYWLGEPHWGRGIGSEAVARFTRWAFEQWPDLSEILAHVHVDNAPSALLLERCGYVRMGTDAPAPDWVIFRKVRQAKGKRTDNLV